MARFDGVEQFSLLLGVALSPWAFETMGYTGCFIFRAVGNFMSIMYLGKAQWAKNGENWNN